MAKNIAPILEDIEVTPANYKFPQPSNPLTPAVQSLTLPPMGRHRRQSNGASVESQSSQTLQYAKGQVGARWLAVDPNGDSMIYKVELRGINESEWKLLRDKVKEKYLSWDSTAFPDGSYKLRLTASDAPDNPPGQALTNQIESDTFMIDNTPPQITGLTGSRSGNQIAVRWKAKDALSVIDQAEYSLDGGEWTVVEPTSRLSDSLELEYALTLNNISPGEHTVAVRVSDEFDNQAVDKTVVR
jgi:hypothetical protein